MFTQSLSHSQPRQGSRQDQKILEEGGGAGPSLLPRRDHEYRVGRWSWAEQVGRLCFKLSKLFVNSGATDIVLVTLSSTAVERAIAQCTSRWAMARGHRLNTSIVLAAVHGLSGLFRAVSAVAPFTLSPPSHSVPVPNRPTRLCGRKATLNQPCLILSALSLCLTLGIFLELLKVLVSSSSLRGPTIKLLIIVIMELGSFTN